MKRLISLVLALVMVLMVGAAFADTIKITRDSSYEGTGARTYTAYKVFDADVAVTAGTNTEADTETITYGDDAISYSMATDSPWKNAMLADAQTWFDVKLAADGSKYIVTLKDGVTNNAATAKAIAAYLKANLPSGLSGETVPTDGNAVAVDKGYYLLLASDGATNLTLVTTDVEIYEKNTYIETGKTSAETNHYVGEKIEYTATVKIPADTNPDVPVILHDEMVAELAFQNDVAAKIDGAAFDGFTVAKEGLTDNCTFEITIPVTSAVLGKTITFTYSAEVTSAAATETGLVNKLGGQHGDYKTTPTEVKDYTFSFDFKKLFTGSDDTSLTAKFELRTTANDATTAIAFNAKNGGKQTKVDSDDGAGSTELQISNKETINLAGLKAGTYYLVETATSNGYNLLDGPVTVIITDTTDKTAANWTPSRKVEYIINGGEKTEGVVTINNNSGTVLPSTGGIGTTIFYVVGGLLLIGAAVVLVARRKASN